jgi:phage N-6-adenine-methyltransferase
VETLLRDAEWGRWSDRKIAQQCQVHHQMVGKVRDALSLDDSSSERTYTTRHGTTATMKTGGITAANRERAAPQPDPEREPDAAPLPAAEPEPIAPVPEASIAPDALPPPAPAAADLTEAQHLRDQLEAQGWTVGSGAHGYVLVRDGKQHRVQDVAGLRRFLDAPEPRAYDRDEWHTPSTMIALARQVLGEIDLDPASSAAAQAVVQARQFFTKAEDGLQQDWHGRVWLNPPYSNPAPWIDRALTAYAAGQVLALLILVNDQTDAAWYQRLLHAGAAACLLARRVPFWHPDRAGETPRQGQTMVSIGVYPARFAEVFAAHGTLITCYSSADAQPAAGIDALTSGEVKNIWRCLHGDTRWLRQARQSWQRAAAQRGIDLAATAEEAA